MSTNNKCYVQWFTMKSTNVKFLWKGVRAKKYFMLKNIWFPNIQFCNHEYRLKVFLVSWIQRESLITKLSREAVWCFCLNVSTWRKFVTWSLLLHFFQWLSYTLFDMVQSSVFLVCHGYFLSVKWPP